MEVASSSVFVVLFVAVSAPSCLACNGYQISKLEMKNCDDSGEDIIQLKDFNLTLKDDCTVKVDGCMRLDKRITSATGRYSVKKDMVAFKGKKDICKELEKAKNDVYEVFEFMSVSAKCPIEAVNACGPQETYNITKYKPYLHLLKGKSKANLVLYSDSGKACINATVQIVKK